MPEPMISTPFSALDLEDREHEVLLAQGRCALDAELLGHGDEFGGGFFLEVFQMHCVSFLGELDEMALGRKRGMRQDAASGRNGRRRRMETGRFSRRASRYGLRCAASIGVERAKRNASERPHDHEDDDDRGSDAGNLVHDPQACDCSSGALAGGEPLAIAAEPALIAGQTRRPARAWRATSPGPRLGDRPASARASRRRSSPA